MQPMQPEPEPQSGSGCSRLTVARSDTAPSAGLELHTFACCSIIRYRGVCRGLLHPIAAIAPSAVTMTTAPAAEASKTPGASAAGCPTTG